IARAKKHKEYVKKKKESTDAVNDDTSFTEEDLKQSSYYFENGLRKVYPYKFVFATYAKGRWVGRTIYDVLSKEFGFNLPGDLEKAFESGSISVNNNLATADYVLKTNDLISHQTHRHENPVTSAPLEIIANTDDMLVINKPSSIPCHPCGRYRFNSVIFILGKEMGFTNLRNIYRLDRLTSGVLVLCKNVQRTKALMDQVAKRQVQKEYVCRVVGHFPE
ncbi:RNA pseudouridylate synthase domain-containing protein 2, partial [Biomphalaria glabrata]